MPLRVSCVKPCPSIKELIESADQAWSNKDTGRSEILYCQILAQNDLPLFEKTRSWERYTLSLMANGRILDASAALDKWQMAIPGTRSVLAWQDAVLRIAQEANDSEGRLVTLSCLVNDSAMPIRLRSNAGVILALEYCKIRSFQRAIAILDFLRNVAMSSGEQDIVDLEATFFASIQTVESEVLSGLEALGSSDKQVGFPFTILALERARRLAMNKTNWFMVKRLVASLCSQLVNKTLVDAITSPSIIDVESAIMGVIFVLPLTGKMGDIGWEIVRGADVAQQELANTGQNVVFEFVDTESPDWQDKLKSLPKCFRFVGGPLLIETIKILESSDILSQRAFFAFLNNLGTIQEGRQAWRFFSSPEDQVRAILDFGTRELHIKKAIVLYPDDAFGRRMADIFYEEAQRLCVKIPNLYVYLTTDRKVWYDTVDRIVKSGDFDAIFLPGDWDHAEFFIPNFFCHRKERTFIFGTALWGQTLARRKNYFVDYDFRWTVFPGAWWPGNPALAADRLKERFAIESQGQPNFWTVLGYDFTRFIARMGQLPEVWDSTVVNSLLHYAQNIEWSMAPINYDAKGMAHQALYLFRPTKDGFIPALAKELLVDFSVEPVV